MNLPVILFCTLLQYLYCNVEAAGVKVASFRFEYVKAELILALFIVLIGFFKLLYHHYKYPRALIPESCCLIILGVFLGLIFFYVNADSHTNPVKFLEFDSKIFFFFLLPPIILESAYSLNDPAFYHNVGVIIVFAVFGTVMNIMLVGGSLIALDKFGLFGKLGFSSLDCLLFASLIAAVDPVAVLAIFAEVGVNKTLYFMVFGESLLNDAVTVVCYNLVEDFKKLDSVTVFDVLLGILSFLTVSFGGLFIGLACGLLSSYVTKFTISARVVEPVICLGMAYLSYSCSELFHFSGIIAIICCGIVQARYTIKNLSTKSNISISYAVKVISSVSESLIFIILGVMLVNEKKLVLERLAPVVFGLSYIVNKVTSSNRHISFREQIIMAYGGLRGAVSFSLAFMISESSPAKSTILAATYLVIIFTVFVQGCSIEGLVKVLNITLAKKDDQYRLFNAFNKGMLQHMATGVEEVLGFSSTSVFKKVAEINRKYIQPCLERDYKKKDAYERLVLLENEERLKESLLDSSTKKNINLTLSSSQAELNKFEILNDHNEQIARKKSRESRRDKETTKINIEEDGDVEAEVDDLIYDLDKINALVSGSYSYHADRNLTNDAAFDRQRSIKGWQKHINRLHDLSFHETKKKRRLMGLRRSANVKKMSIRHGVLAASAGAMTVGNRT
ncbi:unnamed protein product [Bursaphelenchus okinawaensis]|uniref:Sodium/hydrogen exchanger n=1 Tax=Bursaphelenchus okinawaensis TaxID=465554 RepID=A0A811LHT7_9BILA|nr:unnamed protein product [Bursaphelenchus okinawaensis]CAG9123511.1 unnamed protein product [Bursaphelenchus okinawaensis]